LPESLMAEGVAEIFVIVRCGWFVFQPSGFQVFRLFSRGRFQDGTRDEFGGEAGLDFGAGRQARCAREGVGVQGRAGEAQVPEARA